MSHLFLDTSSGCHLVILSHSNSEFSGLYIRPEPQVSSLFLLEAIDGFLQEANITYDQLQGLMVGRGPGSLTSLRTALSVSQGICVATKIPVWAFSSMHWYCLAAQMRYGIEQVRLLMDARSEQVYVASLLDDAFNVSLCHQSEISSDPIVQKTCVIGSLRNAPNLDCVDETWLEHLNQAALRLISTQSPRDVDVIQGIYLKSPV